MRAILSWESSLCCGALCGASCSGRWGRTVRCWGGEDELSARRGAGNVSSRPEQGKTVTHTHTKCLPPLNHWYTPTHINNGQLISSVWLSCASLFLIHECLGSIPRPPLGLKWDDMGFFMSTKIGGILAFALGKISPWVLFRLGATLDGETQKTASQSFIFFLHLKCHPMIVIFIYLHQCCMMVMRPAPWPAACSTPIDGGRCWVSILRW